MNPSKANSQTKPNNLERIQLQESLSFEEVYLRGAERESSCCGEGRFTLRFPIIEDSIVNGGMMKAGWAFLKFKCSNELGTQNIPADTQRLEQELPIIRPIFQNTADKIRYTWIGHSTAVISFGKTANFLIDPVFLERCSPFQFLGPKRYRRPACSIAELQRIHLVLVSHDHYDHLEADALEQLNHRFSPQFIAGIGSRSIFPKQCLLTELDWAESSNFTVNGEVFEVTFVPACHWSRRGPFDLNTRLWGGFVIKGPNNRKVFYSGDTAYCEVFKEIGAKFGPFDLCVLPIGAYEPRHLLSAQHVNPEEAVVVHKELRSRKSVGVHWGTFPLGWEHYLSPRVDLAKACLKHQLREGQFVTIGHGESLEVDY